MKKIIYLFGLLLFLSSCNNSDLYKVTDDIISSIDEGGGYNIWQVNSKITEDKKYIIIPIGKLIIVKINNYVENEEYEKLKIKIERRYKNNKIVKNVFINGHGTITIDCR